MFVAAGGGATYDDNADPLSKTPTVSHFWEDLIAQPINLHWTAPLDALAAAQLPKISGINRIAIGGMAADADLRPLESIHAHRICILDSKHTTTTAETRLQHLLPQTEILLYGKNYYPFGPIGTNHLIK